jgi:hypothetical protein
MAGQYVTVSFGPEEKYSLFIPVTAENQEQLATQLKKAAVTVKTIAAASAAPQQRVFDFCTK